MKLVLDANIFLSSFFWGGNPRKVLERVIAGIDELFEAVPKLQFLEQLP